MELQDKIRVIEDFIRYCAEYLKIEELPKIELTVDRSWVVSIKSFGQYINKVNSLKVYIKDRNLADILRTVSHELVHHKQNELNLMHSKAGDTASDIENQANAIAGIIMRNYGKNHEIIYENKLSYILEDISTSSMSIYCDMDGVLTDFDAQFDHYYGVTPKEYYREKGSDILKKAVDEVGIDFWAKMPYFPGAERLWSYIAKYNPIILSSPSTFKFAQRGKLMWIKNYLNPQPSQIIFKQTGNKHEILKSKDLSTIKKCILIDDFYKNIAPWKEMGGIGITHKSAESTISILKKFRL